MARKYGKKVEINLNPLNYNIALMGESGIGKSTIIKEVCEILVGKDGYIAFDFGREDGHSAISGMISEKINSWEKLKEVTDDIVDNKSTDYKDLKTVVIDTYDELLTLAEAEAIRSYNIKNIDKIKVESINAAWGGFGEGLDKAIELIFDILWGLKDVGVSFIIILHTKKKDIDDPVTGQQYSVLTSNISQRYFNAIKSKLHFLGVAYVDRNIIQVRTGKKDIKTKEDIKIGKVTSESRVIGFRDETYSIDSKSRFADIVDSVEFTAEAFIKAMQDAILKEQQKDGVSIEDAMIKQKEEEAEKIKAASEYIENKKNNKADNLQKEELLGVVRTKYIGATDDIKESIKKIMVDNGIENFKSADIPTKALKEIVYLLQ